MNPVFAAARRRARSMSGNPLALGRLLWKSALRLRRGEWQGELQRLRDEVAEFIELLRLYTEGEYTGLSRSTLVKVVAALLYFVWLADLVPDIIVGLGLLDDAAVVAWVYQSIQEELQAFRQWQQDRK
jgi:uncharacterized membrane protein YkvA (DUF1232 family)